MLVGGFCAGFLNSLAGFGSIITLAIFMDILGLPGHVANATNRVNVLSSSIVSSATYYKNGKLDLVKGKKYIFIVAAGAIVGILLAADLNDTEFKSLFNYLLIPIFFIILINPKRFISPDMSTDKMSNWVVFPLFFIFGLYAGLIQVGFGVLFLMVMVMMLKYDLIESNAIKVATVGIYTVIAILIFHYNGLINWKFGLLMAVGQGFGGFVAAKYSSTMENANRYAYYLLVAIVLAVIIKNFEIWKIFIS